MIGGWDLDEESNKTQSESVSWWLGKLHFHCEHIYSKVALNHQACRILCGRWGKWRWLMTSWCGNYCIKTFETSNFCSLCQPRRVWIEAELFVVLQMKLPFNSNDEHMKSTKYHWITMTNQINKRMTSSPRLLTQNLRNHSNWRA